MEFTGKIWFTKFAGNLKKSVRQHLINTLTQINFLPLISTSGRLLAINTMIDHGLFCIFAAGCLLDLWKQAINCLFISEVNVNYIIYDRFYIVKEVCLYSKFDRNIYPDWREASIQNANAKIDLFVLFSDNHEGRSEILPGISWKQWKMDGCTS